MTAGQGIKTGNASDCEVYRTLSVALDFANQDEELWWHSTAPMFAQMLQSTNYNLHAQYKHLLIYKKNVIPFLGVYPTNDKPRWLSILTRYGTPFELSLNCSGPLVRYTYEPINAATGTARDPFNTHAVWDSLEQLMALQSGIDLDLFRHFKNDLTLSAEESEYLYKNNLVGEQIRTQNKLALDLQDGEFVVKTYIYPALKSLATGRSIHELVFGSAFRWSKQYPELRKPLDTLEQYVYSRGPSSTASPRLLSCDLIDPTKSRIKIYLLERMVTLEALEDLWTMGGERTDASTLAGLEMIRELWELIRLPAGLQSYPAPYLPIGTIPDEQLPLMANYTIHHDDPVPEPQVYFTTFGRNDMQIADALATFFERRGWHEMARQYKAELCSHYPHADHETLNYLHAYISFSYRKNKPYLSVYLQSLETGDWVTSSFNSVHVDPGLSATVQELSKLTKTAGTTVRETKLPLTPDGSEPGVITQY
ncbi:tryptophan dimethylallyltransferase [Aspergillus indologenus CBS 114.80]|uniref:Tryptophan dimethylallyltransferase n=1 Tax=Aspergillus indologenus CBS 114.80 TaxID=1450541 RepID=A0A2V5IAP8_9EURO|nr:tryptophan dimethylallyltransferase [Aspergillus indologenus CBS 114.80]